MGKEQRAVVVVVVAAAAAAAAVVVGRQRDGVTDRGGGRAQGTAENR